MDLGSFIFFIFQGYIFISKTYSYSSSSPTLKVIFLLSLGIINWYKIPKQFGKMDVEQVLLLRDEDTLLGCFEIILCQQSYVS